MPAMHLISVVLPAPLSPTSAVTGPKCLLMPFSRSSGADMSAGVGVLDPGPDGAWPASAGQAPSGVPGVTTAGGLLCLERPCLPRNPGCRAGGLVLACA